MNKDIYRKDPEALQKKGEDFLNKILRPYEDFECIFKIENFNAGNKPINILDSEIKSINRKELTGLGISSKTQLGRKILSDFSNKTVVIVQASGNNEEYIMQRAKDKAKHRLYALQTVMSSNRLYADFFLQYGLSDYAIYRKVKDHSYMRVWKFYSNAPEEASFSLTTENFIAADLDQMNKVNGFSDDLRNATERAIMWIGKAISEEDYDTKVTFLCTALESILTLESDGLKGEKIAYRIPIMNSILGKGFVRPIRMLYLYILRSKVVHGTETSICSKDDYQQLLFTTKETLFNFINFVESRDIKKLNKFIKALDTSEEFDKVFEWIKEFDESKYTKDILKAMIKVRNNQ